jgi:hypothetical protein
LDCASQNHSIFLAPELRRKLGSHARQLVPGEAATLSTAAAVESDLVEYGSGVTVTMEGIN